LRITEMMGADVIGGAVATLRRIPGSGRHGLSVLIVHGSRHSLWKEGIVGWQGRWARGTISSYSRPWIPIFDWSELHRRRRGGSHRMGYFLP
jgi:hypothetical protein